MCSCHRCYPQSPLIMLAFKPLLVAVVFIGAWIVLQLCFQQKHDGTHKTTELCLPWFFNTRKEVPVSVISVWGGRRKFEKNTCRMNSILHLRLTKINHVFHTCGFFVDSLHLRFCQGYDQKVGLHNLWFWRSQQGGETSTIELADGSISTLCRCSSRSHHFTKIRGFTADRTYALIKQGSLNYLFGEDQTLQMYDDFEAFPL